MPADGTAAHTSPAETVAAIACRARRFETRLADHPLVWRGWGRGRPLVLLHGGYGSWTHWIANVEALATRHFVLAPDLPGFGESGDPDDPATAEGVATPVLAGLDRIIGGQTAFDIAAFSFGGSVAGVIAARLGSRVGRLALVGSGGLRLGRAEPVALTSTRGVEDAAAIDTIHRANLAAFMLHRAESVDDLAAYVQAQNVARARVKSRRISRMGVLHDLLPRIPARLIGIWGEEDAIARGHLDARESLLKACDPRAAFHRVPEAGHWVQYERAPAVNAILAQELGGT
ncbi:alpha/beta fold hydrolase [Ancylobacter terrae]|uniref:alpha/beta fold hydrolase n=1 Tax=Ancylobacter sp. sgz301288 TaxID=3342077 RepID=UPI00385AEDD2